MANRIHPTAIIGDGVEMGSGNVIGPYVVVEGPCVLGDDNWVGPHATLGMPAQIRGARERPVTPPTEARGVSIGNGCVIREYASVHQGHAAITEVADDCYLSTGSNVPHDAKIGTGCTLSAGVQIGGHTILQAGVNVGMAAVIHQFSTIGQHAMIGMQAAVTRDIPPFALAYGVPAVVRGANRVAMSRNGLDDAVIAAVEQHLLAQRPLEDVPGEVRDAFASFARHSRRAALS